VRVLVSGEVHVDYGQIYVESRDDFGADLQECFAGQTNGLCGAAVPGYLFLITGLHTGYIGFTVELHEDRPPLDEAWEEVVEASFRPASPRTALVQWAGENSWDLGLDQIDYRVRYCASGMDQAHQAGTRLEGEMPLDRYLLQLWPARPEPGTVVKQTSGHAEYWHGFAVGLPPPPTPQERAEAERRQRAEAEREAEAVRLAAETRRWGGRLPSTRLSEAGGHAHAVAMLDFDLAEIIAQTDPGIQRSIARWVTRRAYTLAGLAGIGWIAPALQALDQGQALPPPFDEHQQVWDRLFSDPRVPHTTVTLPGGSVSNFLQQAAAVPALFGAVHPDPLHAAFDAVHAAAAAYGDDAYPALFQELRAAFRL
jgi:hypothetical protein